LVYHPELPDAGRLAEAMGSAGVISCRRSRARNRAQEEARAVPSRPIPQAPDDLWRQAELRRAFWATHLDDLRRRYPDQFVAVSDGAVVAAAPTLQALDERLAVRGLTDRRAVWVQFIEVTPRELHL
jgi:hypothetical protein